MKHFPSLGRYAAALLLAAAPMALQAQTAPGVGIGTTTPDASAALDIVSSAKGVLLPRVAAATAIASPAPGLLVYQTGAPAGFYYNAGTAAAPSWQRIGTTANGDNLGNHTATTNVGLNNNWLSNAAGNANGLRVDNSGNVGVGTAAPLSRLSIQQVTAISGTPGQNLGELSFVGFNRSVASASVQALTRDFDDTGHLLFKTSPNGGGAVERLRVTADGNVGVGTAAPVTQLSNSASNVIATDGNGISSQALNWVSTTTGYAAGVANTGTAGNSNGLAVKVSGSDGVALDVSRGAIAAPGSSLLRVLGGGNVGVGVSSPTQKLDVDGGILARAYSAIGNQGAYLQWNRNNGDGATWLLNQRGGGPGGIYFGSATTGNATTEWARFDGNGNLGIGTNAPARKLDVAGSAAVSANLQVGTAATDGTFEVMGGAYATQALDQQQLAFSGSVGNGFWQSFTAGASGLLRQLDLGVSSPGDNVAANATLRVYAGSGTGGTLLASQTVVLAPQAAGFTGLQAYPLSTLVPVVAGQVYTYQLQPLSGNFAYVRVTTYDSYAGGTYSPTAGWDAVFKTYVSTRTGGTNLVVTALGNVGVGTASPSQKLEVTGGVKIAGSGNGLTFPDNTVQTTAAAVGSFIQNQTSTDQTGGFRVSGNGYVAGNVGIGTTIASQKLEVAGQVFSSSGGFRFPNNTVQTTAATDAQQLSISGSTISLTSGGSVTVPSSADNLGNHLATQALNLQGNALTGTGSSITGIGVGIRADGGLNLGQNTTGNNILLGYEAGRSTTAGINNLFVGFNSGRANITGSDNVFVGYHSGLSNTTGIQNTFVGSSSGQQSQPGSLMTALGYNAGPIVSGLSNATAVGANVQLRQSNTVILGNGANVGIGTSTPRFPLTVEPNQFGEFMSFNQGGGSSGYFNFTLDGGNLSLNELRSGIGMLNWRLLVQSATGHVGIGVQSPIQRLDVDGGILARGAAPVGNQGSYLLWNRSGGQGETWLLNQQGSGTGGIRFGRVTVGNNVTEWARFLDNGNFGIGTDNPGQKLTVIGAICASLGVNCTSDARYKEQVTTLPDALANVLKLRGVYYHWKQAEFPQMQFPATRQLGFIAQEIEPFYPEMVTTDANGYKSVDYSRLTPVLVEALKEQQQQIEALKQQAAAAKAEATAAKAQAATTATELQTMKNQTTATLESLAQRLRALEAGGTQARK